MPHSTISRVSLAAQNEEFGTAGGFVTARTTRPVTCSVAAAIFAGVSAAFITGAAIVGAYHFGHKFHSEELIDGSHVECDSLDRLIDSRLVAYAS
jgi:hypothetical protein